MKAINETFHFLGTAMRLLTHKITLGLCLGALLFILFNHLCHGWVGIWAEFKHMTGDYVDTAVAEMAYARGFEPTAPIIEETLEQIIYDECKANEVNPTLVLSVIKHESRSNPWATSHVGAMGLMQLMPETAKACGLRDATEARSPRENIACGVWWLRKNLEQTNYNVLQALQGYNGGPRAIATIKRCGGNADCLGGYRESFNYANNVYGDFIRGRL